MSGSPSPCPPVGAWACLHRWVLERVLQSWEVGGGGAYKTVQGLASTLEGVHRLCPRRRPLPIPQTRASSKSSPRPVPAPLLGGSASPLLHSWSFSVRLPGPWPPCGPLLSRPSASGRLLPPCLFTAVGVHFVRAGPHPSTSSASGIHGASHAPGTQDHRGRLCSPQPGGSGRVHSARKWQTKDLNLALIGGWCFPIGWIEGVCH